MEKAVSARDQVLGAIRRSLGVSASDVRRHTAVLDRLTEHPRGVVPRRGQMPGPEQRALFIRMVQEAAGTVATVEAVDEVPAAVATLLRGHNLRLAVRRGADAFLAALPWQKESIDVSEGPSDGIQAVGVSHAFAAIAETGTLVLTSGADNPTTLNFLPSNHIVVVRESELVGDFETVLDRLRQAYGALLPRAVNLVTGPSRSADIEQTLILGAHGPLRLHVILVPG
jgi:L-lactate dehydrogenase complex protein LldG